MPETKDSDPIVTMQNDDRNILQLLDQSACLSKSQLLGYLNHTLYPEELRVVELHLSSCPLCNDALEGFESVQHAESLIASVVPPVLPAIVLPEKPVEKKDPEPQPAYTPSKKQSRAKLHAESAVQERNRLNSNPQGIWLKTIGVAAALVIGFGLIWYFELGSKDDEQNMALSNLPEADRALPPGDTSVATATIAAMPDSAKINAAKKVSDSVYLAAVKAEKLKAHKDSLANVIAANKADTATFNETKQSALMAANEQADTEDQQVNAKKQPSASDAVAMAPKKKEDSKAVKSDFELGMEQYRQNNFASALLYFKTAESNEKDPKHWEAVYLSGMCNKSLDKKRKAIRYFERVVEAKAPQAKAAQKQIDNLKGDK